MRGAEDRRACLLWATLAAALAFAGQFITVHYNYRGNWTGLFCHGSRFPVPPALRAENVHVFANSDGFDGQFYHFIAHDPFIKGDTPYYIDAPRLRYRRILVPLLAWLLSAGGGRALHAAYLAVMLGFVWLGAWWLARSAVEQGTHPAWGLAFLAVPGTLISLDRMTVDGPLAALAAGFALYARAGPWWKLFLVLAAAPLVRETGLLFAAACALYEIWQRRPHRAVFLAAGALPALVWYGFVHSRLEGAGVVPLAAPFRGLIARLFAAARYRVGAPISDLAATLDWISLAGALVCFLLALHLIRAHRDVLVVAVALQLLLLSTLNVYFWLDAYGYTRLFSPLLVLLAAGRWSLAWRWRWLPAGLMLPRVGLQLGGQLLGVLRGLLG